MFLKLIAVGKGIALPHKVQQGNLLHVFPRVAQLPSICLTEFTEDGGQGLLHRAPKFFAQASVEEVEAERMRKEALLSSGEQLQMPQRITLTDETVLAGTVKVADFFTLNAGEAVEFIESEELSTDVLRGLLELELQGKARKTVMGVLSELIQAEKPEHSEGNLSEAGE